MHTFAEYNICGHGIDDFAAEHGDADVVADFVRFGRHKASLANEGVWGGWD
jgi:hypothetical protein